MTVASRKKYIDQNGVRIEKAMRTLPRAGSSRRHDISDLKAMAAKYEHALVEISDSTSDNLPAALKALNAFFGRGKSPVAIPDELKESVRDRAAFVYLDAMGHLGYNRVIDGHEIEPKDWGSFAEVMVRVISNPKLLRDVPGHKRLLNQNSDFLGHFLSSMEPDVLPYFVMGIQAAPRLVAANKPLVKAMVQAGADGLGGGMKSPWQYTPAERVRFAASEPKSNRFDPHGVMNAFTGDLKEIGARKAGGAASDIIHLALTYLTDQARDKGNKRPGAQLPDAQGSYANFLKGVEALPPDQQVPYYTTLAYHAYALNPDPQTLARKFLADLDHKDRAVGALRALDILMTALAKEKDTLFGGSTVADIQKKVTQIKDAGAGQPTLRDRAHEFLVFWSGADIGFSGGPKAVGGASLSSMALGGQSFSEHAAPFFRSPTLFFTGGNLKIQFRTVGAPPILREEALEGAIPAVYGARDPRKVTYDVLSADQALSHDVATRGAWQNRCYCCNDPQEIGPHIAAIKALAEKANKDPRFKDSAAFRKFAGRLGSFGEARLKRRVVKTVAPRARAVMTCEAISP